MTDGIGNPIRAVRAHVASALEALHPLRGEDRRRVEPEIADLQDLMARLEARERSL